MQNVLKWKNMQKYCDIFARVVVVVPMNGLSQEVVYIRLRQRFGLDG